MRKVGTAGEIVERALGAARAEYAVVLVDETSSVDLRWAGNALTTNGAVQAQRVTVVAGVRRDDGVGVGVVSWSAVTPDAVPDLVRAAEEAARQSPVAEDAMELPPGDGATAPGYEEAARRAEPDVFAGFAPALGEAFRSAAAGGRELFGFARRRVTTTWLGTSSGLRLRHEQPAGHIELNAKSHGRARTSFAVLPVDDFAACDPVALDAALARRLAWGDRRVELPAGRYETLLPPSAVADLVAFQQFRADGRTAHEGRSVFSRQGGGTRVGERIAHLPVNLWSDPSAPGLASSPHLMVHSSVSAMMPTTSVFDNGLPLGRSDWMRDGVLTGLVTSRHTARLTGLPVNPLPGNLLLDAGGTASLDELVARTERGLLLTSLWYIREVDPRTLLLTGLTRDGVYLVEDGEVTAEVNNFRFNESPVDLLARATEAGVRERCRSREWGDDAARVAMPALRVPDFNMSTVATGV